MNTEKEYSGKFWKHMAFHVHSDRNPEKAKLAGERLAFVMDNKKNEQLLVKRAMTWGIPIPVDIKAWYDSSFKVKTGWNVMFTGNFVDVLFQRGLNKVAFSGYIVDFKRDNTNQKITIYISERNGKIRVVEVKYVNIEILCEADSDGFGYERAKSFYGSFKKENAKKVAAELAKEKRNKVKELFKKVNLKPNNNYKYFGLKMNYDGIWYDVVKTTTNKVILSYCGIEIKINIEDAKKVYA
jgi:hypothetical protein